MMLLACRGLLPFFTEWPVFPLRERKSPRAVVRLIDSFAGISLQNSRQKFPLFSFGLGARCANKLHLGG